MVWQFPLKIQEYCSTSDTWGHREFSTKDEFIAFVQKCFKLPGKYDLKNTTKWQETGNHYRKTVTRPNFEGGLYHKFVKNTIQHKRWKEVEKDRILNGVIYDDEYIPPFYYWYLNYCPIYNDVTKKKDFGNVWDSDLWFFQYIMLCLLLGKHAVVVKARQRGYSFKIMSLLAWSYWWFEGSINTIGAYKEEYANKSWRFLEFYRKHINTNTTWKRGPKIPKAGLWEERTETADGNYIGLDSKLASTTFKVSPENGVGGSQSFFFYEEAGIAPTLLQTVGFVRPALEKGNRTTGLIILSGAVGDLDDCQDLKEVFYNPDAHKFLSVKNIWDKKSGYKKCGLFVSEAYNLEGFIDAEGNSLVEDALEFIDNAKKEVKDNKRADLAQLDASQKPTSPEEAFAQRKKGEFPVEQLQKQQERIKIKDQEKAWKFKPIKCLLDEDDNGQIILKTTNLPREHEYPIKPDWEDKRGVVTIFELPDKSAPWLTYFAGVDPIEVDVTTTSESVASIDIYKRTVKVKYTDEKGKVRTRYEGGKIVANYRGRFDSVEKTNEQMWFLIKLYRAFTWQERSKPNFMNYMKRHGRAEQYLAKESDVPIYKDLNVNAAMSSSNYGFILNAQNQVKKVLKDNMKEYFSTEFDRRETESGEVLKIYTGVDRCDDYWMLEEYIQYQETDGGKMKGNYDRFISSSSAVTIGRVYENQMGIPTIDETKKEKPKETIKQGPKQVNLLGSAKSTNTLTGMRKSKRPQSML